MAGGPTTESASSTDLPSGQGSHKRTPSTFFPRENPNIDDQSALLDPYLPLELRSKDWLHNLARFEGVRPINSLPELLSNVQDPRSRHPSLLSYIGLHQGRWTALLWLIKVMVGATQPTLDMTSDLHLYPMSSDTDMSLDEMTETTKPPFEIRTKSPQSARTLNLDQFTESSKMNLQGRSADSEIDLIGLIWQCVGHIILEAAELGPEDSAKTMSYVHQILAHMHRRGIIPTSLYNYKLAKDPSALKRPPTLHLLSSRILTILSDSAWKAHEKEIIAEAAQAGAKYVYKGHELPGAEYTPRIRQLDPATWLELVLWSCIEGGWIAAASWIVNQMTHRLDKPIWTLINWGTLYSSGINAGSEFNSSGWQSFKARFDRVAGASEGYSEDPPFVEMRSRTVSTEVIEALVDGIACTISSSVDKKITIPIKRALIYINACKELVKNSGEESSFESSWDVLMLRMVEFGGFQAESDPALLKAVANLAALDQKGSQSLASYGILQSVLQFYIHLGDHEGAISAFRKLQRFINPDRALLLEGLRPSYILPVTFKRLQKLLRKRKWDSLHQRVLDDNRELDWKMPEIPEPLLADFLDLLTREKAYWQGKWMLYPTAGYENTKFFEVIEHFEPIIPSTMYSSSYLQPALLRFAQATDDKSLLAEVTKKLATPLSIAIIRTLLHCQIGFEQWDAVEDLLVYIKTVKKRDLNATDVMVVARSLLESPHQLALDADRNTSNQRAQNILRNIFRGVYDTTPDPSLIRDYTQRRLINQIARILASVPSTAATIAAEFIQIKGQAHTATRVPVLAFNLLLDEVVETRGMLAGKRLWDKWCRLPSSEEQDTEADWLPFDVNIDSHGREKVVTPSIRTIRIILAPLIKSMKKLDAKMSWPERISLEKEGSPRRLELMYEHRLMEWGIDMLRRLGMTKDEIDRRLQRYFKES